MPKSINKSKQNLQIQQDQNNLKEMQIMELTPYQSLTMVKVHEQQGILYELETRLLIFNKH